MTYRIKAFRHIAVAAIAVVAISACSTTKAGRRYSRAEAEAALKQFETVGLVIGEFPIKGADAVIDGDTIRVEALESSLRLLGCDTEETFKKQSERDAYAKGWETYKKLMQGDSERPVKLATPLGEEAKQWARAFFEGVTKVRLERDHPGEIRDYYGRYLAYVMVERNGEWLNYNVESVRAGMSPYFTKYGRSRRFDKAFEEAQQQAREARIGVWDPKKRGYGDYEERLVWWNKRADVITRFEKEMEERNDHLVLTRWDAMLQLEQRVGQDVVLLGSVNDIRLGDRGPTVVKLGRSRGSDFDVVFFDKDTFLASGLQHAKGEYVRVRGVVKKYRDRYRDVDRLQIVVSLPGQVLSPSPELDAMLGISSQESTAEAAQPRASTAEGEASSFRFATPPPLPPEDEPD